MATLSIHHAAQQGQVGLLQTLIKEDKGLANGLDLDGRTPLHWAASSGSVDIVQLLLGVSADVNAVDNSGWTSLHIAASAGHFDVVIELIGGGADVNCKNDKGITPLHYAASKSHIEIGKLLLERGTDINAKDNANQHPLHRAASTGSLGFIKLLLHHSTPENKIRLNTGDRMGNTPLHLAMESGHGEAAVILIRAGADPDRKNFDGQTPLNLPGDEQLRVKKYVESQCDIVKLGTRMDGVDQ